MGGALGVAVIGSVLASAYRPGVASRLADLHAPATVISAARDSIGGAVDAASALPEPLRSTVIAASRGEFVSAFHTALVVGTVVLLVAAAVVFALLPARAIAEDATHVDGLATLTFAEAEGTLELAGEPS
jgi:DHA2 family multidrug resistance protein-like MFS transporter